MQLFYSRGFRALSTIIGMGPQSSEISITPEECVIRMGWAFDLSVPTTSIDGARRVTTVRPWWGCGAHLIGRHRWIINGSLKNLVEIFFAEGTQARIPGMNVPVSSVMVSVTDPEEFLAQVRTILPDSPRP